MHNLIAKKQKLIDLLDRKICLVNNLLALNEKVTSFEAIESEQPFSKFSINSLHDLHHSATSKFISSTNIKSDLKKSCLSILEELDIMDNTIYNSVMELLIEKINTIAKQTM